MTPCPDLERIHDLARGLDAASAEETAHLAECARCRARAEWVAAVADAASAGPPEAAPDDVLARAMGIARDPSLAPVRRPRRGWSPARLARPLDPLLAGVRGEAGARRIYVAGSGALEVEVALDPDDAEAWRVTGQVERPGAPAAGDVLAILWRGSAVAAHAAGDPADVFAFARVPPGTYRLEAWSPAAGLALRVVPFTIPLP